MEKIMLIEKYLNENLNTLSSKKNYRWAIMKYFKAIGKNPETYFNEKKEYGEYLGDMMTFIGSLQDYAPLTIHLAITGAKSFLIENDVEFKQKDLKKFAKKTNGRKPITDDRIPTKEELEIIFANASLRYKTAFLFMLSSSVRRGELGQIQLDDIDMDTNPVRVRIRASYTKNNEQRITFISNECKKLLKQWLIERERYLISTCNRLRNNKDMPKDINDNRVFPWDSGNTQTAFVRLLDKVDMNDIDPVTKRHVFHTHCFRKFFRTELAQVIPLDVVECLMGHSGYLTGAYRKYSEKQLAEFYLKGMHVLEVYSSGVPESELDRLKATHEAETKYLEKKIKEQQDIMNDFLERTKWMSILTKEQKLKLQKEIKEGNIKELPEPTEKDKKEIQFERTHKRKED